MNRLKYETSPYLLQHANNPVDWYPWGPRAFARAKEENKPILVSIGYSSCHWCHVMEKESFEDRAVAEVMNRNFINVKVDREEHPDVDSLYMDAVQFITGRGGWPLNMFLTPELKPFFGGTYYPPERRGRMPSWTEVLHHVAQLYHTQRDKVEEVAEKILQAIERHQEPQLSVEDFRIREEPLEDSGGVVAQFKARQDEVYGGFGTAPKFPSIADLRFLLDRYVLEGDVWCGEHLVKTIDRILQGGIYDHIGGGIMRYSTTRDWGVPHFEKMLYDNALLIGLLADITASCLDCNYAYEIQDITEWLMREMSNGKGGYYSAIDADSEGEEGKYYLWSADEIKEVLGEDAGDFAAVFDIAEAGNWEGKNIPRIKVRGTVNRVAAASKKYVEGRKKLLQYRQKTRKMPGLDNKVLPDWNALLVTAWCKSYRATRNEKYKGYAMQTISYLKDTFWQPDYTLYHIAGDAPITGNLDDTAFMIEALHQLYTVSLDPQWLTEAERFMHRAIVDFYDVKKKVFYFTSAHKKDVIVRKINWQDLPVPSGFSTITHQMYSLGVLLKIEDWLRAAEGILDQAKQRLYRYPIGHGRWLSMLLYEEKGHIEIGITGTSYRQEIQKLMEKYLPQCIIAGGDSASGGIPFLMDKPHGQTTAVYLCKQKTCLPPVGHIEEVAHEIEGYIC